MKGRIEISKLQKKKIASNAWRGMALAQETIKKGLRESVYNGAEILFWRDIWLGDTLIALAFKEINLVDSYKLVKDYWSPSGRWMWEDLQGLLPPHVGNRLASIMLCNDEERKDGIGRRGTKT